MAGEALRGHGVSEAERLGAFLCLKSLAGRPALSESEVYKLYARFDEDLKRRGTQLQRGALGTAEPGAMQTSRQGGVCPVIEAVSWVCDVF